MKSLDLSNILIVYTDPDQARLVISSLDNREYVLIIKYGN